MSFEGFNEYRCPEGHEDARDVHCDEPKKCSECGRRWSQIRLVDQTNDPTEYGTWRDVEFREKFGDYVRLGYETQYTLKEG